MTVHLAMTKPAYLKDGSWWCGDCDRPDCMDYDDPSPFKDVRMVICTACERGDVINEDIEENAA